MSECAPECGHLPTSCGGCPNRQSFLTELANLTGMTPDEHREHHEFVRELVEEMMARKRLRRKLVEQVGGWAIITVLGALGTWAWHLFQDWLVKRGP